ncbi:MAG: ImmA/IrrE family metallo-endopeptidase [Pyrinomonadaceae bacterium]
MNLISRKFKRLIKGWNKRPLTEADFYAICEAEGIVVIENGSCHMRWRGLYTVILDVPTIIINANIKGLERLWTMFHELGHHFLHSPSTCFFSESTLHKTQSEANAFAAIALIPERHVKQRPLWELYELDEYAVKLFQIRIELYEIYKV